MISKMKIRIWLFSLFIEQISSLSFNQPKFCLNASWNANGTTVANSNIIGSYPFHVFITTNNTIYAPNTEKGYIVVWSENQTTSRKNISVNSTGIRSLFLTKEYDIYFDAFSLNISVNKWTTSNSINIHPIMFTCGRCYAIFIDIANQLYCSLDSFHQVIRKSLNDTSHSMTIVAGTGIPNSNSSTINNPNGIFVDDNFDLYVADHGNNRIQLFKLNQLNGITIVGNTSIEPTITLFRPSAVILDANKNPFISDYNNNRIVGQGPYGFRCLVGCYGSGSLANQLVTPRAIQFDSYGNLFVVDYGNSRIQKFFLRTNSCSNFTTIIDQESTPIDIISTLPVLINASYNQPKLYSNFVWNPIGITYVNQTTINLQPYSLFINLNNTVYATNRPNFTNFIFTYSIFVINIDDIYYSIGNNTRYEIRRYISQTKIEEIIMNLNGACYGLFIDRNNSLYCSMRDQHQIIQKSLNENSNLLTIVAGLGCNGSTSNKLLNPNGIFVDENFNLYIADSGNNRIQFYRKGELNGITLVGYQSINLTIDLDYPTDVVLDADQYIFIVDCNNHRIIRQISNDFRCIIGCYDGGSTADRLFNPQTMAFDSHGNIFVTDRSNKRIQKFELLNKTINDVSYNQPKFCPNATWNPYGFTFANGTIIGIQPYGLFIDKNNTIYVPSKQYNRIQIWFNGNQTASMTITDNLSQPVSIFVTKNNDIYVFNSEPSYRVDKLHIGMNRTVSVMSTSFNCYGLFVDISNTIYCSIEFQHKVVKKWLDANITNITVIAGTGYAGSSANQLNCPNGIFVDINFDLYVADFINDRIQLFQFGSFNGITLAGNSSLRPTIPLNRPVSVILPTEKNFKRNRLQPRNLILNAVVIQ